MQRLTSRICRVRLDDRRRRRDRPRAERAQVRARDRRDAAEAGAGRLAGLAAYARRLGLQPAQSDQPHERLPPEDGLDARADRSGQPGRHAARARRHDVHPEPGRQHPGRGRDDRRSDLGIPPQAPRRRPAQDQPHARDVGRPDPQLQLGQLRLRARRADGRARVGDEGSRREQARAHERRTDRRQRQADHGPPVPARRRPRLLRRHGARRQDRQGAVALPHDPRARRAGLRIVGRRADGAALARRHLDGAELRSRAEPDLRRHVGDDSRAEVHARRQRQAAPLPQLHAGH